MPIALHQLPDDIDVLKSLVADQVNNNELLVARNEQLQSKVIILQEQLNLALARRYAASSEKISPDQIRLFNEAEVDVEAYIPDADADEDVILVPAHTRRKRGRKPLPANLPRIDVIHEIPESERHCPHDGGLLTEIDAVISEQLDIVPAKIQVIRHIRKKYACSCGHCIKTAPLPPQPIPKSLASPGLLAHITVSKYQDALPLHRQETILKRIGVELPRATLANWMIQAGQLIQPLINLLRDRLLAYDILQMDETTVHDCRDAGGRATHGAVAEVLKEPHKTAQSKSYLWVQRGGPPAQRIVLYDYDPSRSQSVPQRLLEGFKGYLQTDGYDGYNAVVVMGGLTHIGCWAHARRKFDEAIRAQGKQKRRGKAHRGLTLIQKLYWVEKQARLFTPEERFTYRRQHAQPMLDALRAWLDEALPQVPPKSATGKALNYLNNEWPKLIGYLNDGRLAIDTKSRRFRRQPD